MADLRRRGERRPRSRWPAAPTPVLGRHRKLVADPLLPATGAKPPVFGRRRKFPVKNGSFGVIFPTEKRGFGICVRQNPRSQLSQAKFHDTKHTVFGRNERACVKNSESGAFNRRGRGEFHSLLPRSTPRGAVRPSLPALRRAAPLRLPRAALCGAVHPPPPLRSAFPALPCLGPFRPLPRFGARSLSSNSHRRASSSSLSSSRAPFSAPMLLSRIRRRLLSLIVTKNCDNVFIVAIHCDNMAPWEFGQFLWRRNWACQARFREKGPGVSGPVPQEGESAPGGAKEMAAREARPRIT